jgi:nicotinamide-nucleotide amidase
MSDVAVAAGEVDALALDVASRLEAAKATVATAESLTGGLLGAALTGVPGVSRSYLGGVVAYATPVKAALLGVPEETLRRDGAVAATTALAMARGVRERLGASYGVATTGVAGPDPAEGKPPGTVFVAVAGPDGEQARHHRIEGDRDGVRRTTCAAALALLRDRLSASADADGYRGEAAKQ